MLEHASDLPSVCEVEAVQSQQAFDVWPRHTPRVAATSVDELVNRPQSSGWREILLAPVRNCLKFNAATGGSRGSVADLLWIVSRTLRFVARLYGLRSGRKIRLAASAYSP